MYLYTIKTGATKNKKVSKIVRNKIEKAGFKSAEVYRSEKGFYIYVTKTKDYRNAQNIANQINEMGYSAHIETIKEQ